MSATEPDSISVSITQFLEQPFFRGQPLRHWFKFTLPELIEKDLALAAERYDASAARFTDKRGDPLSGSDGRMEGYIPALYEKRRVEYGIPGSSFGTLYRNRGRFLWLSDLRSFVTENLLPTLHDLESGKKPTPYHQGVIEEAAEMHVQKFFSILQDHAQDKHLGMENWREADKSIKGFFATLARKISNETGIDKIFTHPGNKPSLGY